MQFDNKISALLSYKPLQLISLPHVQSCLLRGKKKAPSKILLECVSLCHCALRKGKPPSHYLPLYEFTGLGVPVRKFPRFKKAASMLASVKAP